MNLVSVTAPARGQRWRAVRFAAIAGVGALAAMTFSPPPAQAWDTYSAEEYPSWLGNPPVGNCQTCHGQFRATNEENRRPYLRDEYFSLADGQPWSVFYDGEEEVGLHDIHRHVMIDSCSTCHGGSRYPVYLSRTEFVDPDGKVTAGDGISCAGCHGRQEDAGVAITDENGTIIDYAGSGAGLRQHHTNAGVNVCKTCHADADPARYTPVGEDFLPLYYAEAAFVNGPTNPCNPHGEEDYAATKLGLDNDGDGLYDKQDPDCRPIGPGKSNGKSGK